mgnify:CR=1 FL=1
MYDRDSEANSSVNNKWRIYFFPHFHYDVVWKFEREDYSYINLRIFRQVIALCSLFPEFKFGIEDTYQFMEIENREPELFKKISECVKEGCIKVIDGQYLMADSFLPGGEVFVREILYGKRYVKKKFGLDVKVGWITDSFGLNAQIPQIYKDAGYRWLAFGRGFERKDHKSEFWWKGLDGTKILTHYFPSKHSYHVGLFAEYFKENVEELKSCAATKNVLMPCGVGSCPFPEWVLKTIEDFNKRYSEHYEVKIAPPEEFFQAVEKEGDKLEIIEGEMYGGERIFEGVWSTRMWIKLEYFKVKNLILNAEKFSTIAWLLGKPYPKQKFEEAWRRILFIAFHDVITGTSIDEVFEEVKEHFRWLKGTLTSILEDSLDYIASKIDLDGEAFIIFNPNSFNVKSYVEGELEFKGSEKVKGVAIKGSDYEIVREDRDKDGWLRRIKIGFTADIPPLGYKVYKILKSQTNTKAGKRRIIYGKTSIENPYIKVEVNMFNGKCRIFDKEGNEIVKDLTLELENEVGSVYTHRDISKDLVGVIGAEGDTSPNKPVFKVEDFRVEEGKLCKKIRLKEKVYGCFWPYRLREHYGVEFYRQSLIDIEKEITVFNNIPWVEYALKLKNSFPHVRVRARFDVNFDGDYFANTAFGVIKREKEVKDFPMEDWLEYGNRKQGVTISTWGIPGHQVNKNNIYLTLLRSVNMVSHGDKGPIVPVQDALEIKKTYRFKFALLYHQGDWRESKVWIKALSFINPPILVHYTIGRKTKQKRKQLPGDSFSFLSLPENVVLSCLKQSEDGDCIILRCYETAGESVKFKPTFFKTPKKIFASNIMEEKEVEIVEDIQVKPFQILTLKIKF